MNHRIPSAHTDASDLEGLSTIANAADESVSGWLTPGRDLKPIAGARRFARW